MVDTSPDLIVYHQLSNQYRSHKNADIDLLKFDIIQIQNVSP